MSKTNQFISLIEQVLSTSYKVNVSRIDYPYNNFLGADYKIRNLLWGNEKYSNQYFSESLLKAENNYIYIIKSALGFTSIFYRFPKEYGDEIIVIGPFLTRELDNDFYSELIDKNGFSLNVMQFIRPFFQSFPLIDESAILSTLLALLSHLVPEFNADYVHHKSFQSEKNHIVSSDETIDLAYQSYFNECFEIHNTFFKRVAIGDYQEAVILLDEYIQKSGMMAESSLSELRHTLFAFNTKCEYVLMQEKINYMYVRNLHLKIEADIKNEKSIHKLKRLPHEITKKYCHLVVNHSMANYSMTVCKAIDYINLHLSENLSLSIIAEQLKKNPSALSSQFTKEVNETITDFIKRKRIQQATLLLNTTNLSIQEISIKVGILDPGYFCKIFKKFIGMSPSNYQKLLKG